MIAAIWFCAGAVTGIIATIGIGIGIAIIKHTMTTGPQSVYDQLQRRLR
jgi:hypothetical protein